MHYFFLLIMLPLFALPVLVYGDAVLSDYTNLSKTNARTLADYALGQAVTKIKATPTFSGVFKKCSGGAVSGCYVYQVTQPSGTTRHVLAVAYPLGMPKAVARVEALFETTDTNATWHLLGGKQFTVGGLLYQALPINRQTGGL